MLFQHRVVAAPEFTMSPGEIIAELAVLGA
jgi:hypothetical protein